MAWYFDFPFLNFLFYLLASQKQDHGGNAGIEGGKNDSDKAWEQILESFKQQSLKMQTVSQEAFMVYSKNAMTMLEETSKTLKIQADKAKIDIADITKEISEEGSQYITAARDNSPDFIKDVVQVFSALPEFNDISKHQDFYLGIPYGMTSNPHIDFIFGQFRTHTICF